ncbi:universal stress protein [Mycobacterium heckeshornense]|uniref:Universal stress protein n=1 Tax=Mycobacterium heckeshornense TaxID=110505 RepID=A0A2G8B6W3_9MYCO|nr:universal stress protein [Mycobacterium heckeshornense]KMV18842.1 universal stress protein UspA [Mycobacterium heckeshornense]MCV7036691.1 universal stress protein [Mycobacterium heckeshornense]PIJ33501.1 universal stress protein [Mycobacterium heckeshornense]BCO34875.1 universal stress protein [Mycobacterium heckeshornense]BCQ08040.1 universal stress protein [Mycobacterium heckeshornense]
MSQAARDYGVIVGVDGSPASNAAVAWAAHDAVLRHLPLTLVHVVNPVLATWTYTPQPDGFAVWQENEGRRILRDALKIGEDSVKHGESVPIESELIFSSTVEALLDLSTHAELVVVGSSGRGALARGLLGSVSSSLVRHGHCPVAVIRDDDVLSSRRSNAPVLVGIDGSPRSELATTIAFDEASRRHVDLIAMHAWSDLEIFELPGLDWAAVKAEEERSLAERLAGWQENYPDVTVQRVLVCDRPARALIETSEGVQLVVLGSHGRGTFSGMLLGSVSNAVVQAIRVPVIVARSRDRENR